MNEQKIHNNRNVYDVKINKKIPLLIWCIPVLLGGYILILGSFALSVSEVFVSYLNFLAWTYIIVVSAYMLQNPLTKLGLLRLRIFKLSKLERDIPISELDNLLRIKIDLKELRKRWFFHCYCSFGLSLGWVNTFLRLFFKDLSIRYSIVGFFFFLSPILVLFLSPIYYVIKDTTSFNKYIAKSIKGKINYVNIFPLLFFIENILTLEYNLVNILTFSSFFLYSLLSNLLICFIYYTEPESSKQSYSYFVNSYINSLKVKHFLSTVRD